MMRKALWILGILVLAVFFGWLGRWLYLDATGKDGKWHLVRICPIDGEIFRFTNDRYCDKHGVYNWLVSAKLQPNGHVAINKKVITDQLYDNP